MLNLTSHISTGDLETRAYQRSRRFNAVLDDRYRDGAIATFTYDAEILFAPFKRKLYGSTNRLNCLNAVGIFFIGKDD